MPTTWALWLKGWYSAMTNVRLSSCITLWIAPLSVSGRKMTKYVNLFKHNLLPQTSSLKSSIWLIHHQRFGLKEKMFCCFSPWGNYCLHLTHWAVCCCEGAWRAVRGVLHTDTLTHNIWQPGLEPPNLQLPAHPLYSVRHSQALLRSALRWNCNLHNAVMWLLHYILYDNWLAILTGLDMWCSLFLTLFKRHILRETCDTPHDASWERTKSSNHTPEMQVRTREVKPAGLILGHRRTQTRPVHYETWNIIKSYNTGCCLSDYLQLNICSFKMWNHGLLKLLRGTSVCNNLYNVDYYSKAHNA